MKKKFFTFFLALVASVWMSFAKEGALTGAFTINASGDQIVFSKGNLQYQASTQTWRFAENQYDTIGGENSNISASYSGWIDLFGWGTGNNPINTSQNEEDYATFVDWGNNIEGGWRTLTKDEWLYLFCGRTDAAHLFGMGSVNGVNGTILLPDNWEGAKFTDTDNGLDYNEYGYYYNQAGTSYSFHTYTAEQWQTMEKAGAVFLPAAGNRNGTNVGGVGSGGYYWSATSFDESNAYYMYFISYGLHSQYFNGRHNAISVRLVAAAIPNSITINGTPAVGDNSISLTYYFNPANVSRFDMYYAPTLKVKCVTDNTYDEIWLSNTQISSGTETINLSTLGEFKAGKSYVVCFAYRTYKTEDWVDEVFQSFYFPDPSTAIDNANANAKAVKRIENGQLLIIRDGKTYNVVGTIVR